MTLLHAGAALLAGFFVLYSITDGDIFWHLSAGREIIANKKLLYSDPFSFTTPHARWINLHWLFQIVMYGIERLGGYTALLIAKALIVASALYMVIRSFRLTPGTLIVSSTAALIIYYQRYLIPLRPIIVSLLLTAMVIAALERYCRQGNRLPLLIVLICQIIWANSQGLFLLGPAIAAMYAVGEYGNQLFHRRFPSLFTYHANKPPSYYLTLFALPPAQIVISLINPYGWRSLLFALSLFVRLDPSEKNIYSNTITENMPLPEMMGTEYSSYVVITAAIVFIVVLSILSAPHRFRFAHLLLAAAGFVLAWMAQRNGILFTFLALPALFWNLQNHLSITRRKTGAVLTITIFVLLFISLGGVSINHLRMLYSWPHTHSPFSHPAESAKLLKNTPPTGNLFNADRFGGYLLWHVYPTYRVSHDTRLTMRSASFFREYLSLTSHPETFQEYARKWNITRVVLPLAPIDLYLPLAASLYRHPGWKCVYTDGAEILFAADNLGSTPGIDMNAPSAIKAIVSRLSQKFSSRPQLFNEALTWFGRWCAFAGAYRSAENVLSRCRSINGEIILAGVKEQQGHLHQAERRYRKLITDYPGNHTIQIEAALFFLRTGRENDGLHLLSAVLKKDPFNKRARDILLRITTSDKE